MVIQIWQKYFLNRSVASQRRELSANVLHVKPFLLKYANRTSLKTLTPPGICRVLKHLWAEFAAYWACRKLLMTVLGGRPGCREVFFFLLTFYCRNFQIYKEVERIVHLASQLKSLQLPAIHVSSVSLMFPPAPGVFKSNFHIYHSSGLFLF